MPKPFWDETFIELTMEDAQQMIRDAIKSRRKRFEQAILIRNEREAITISVVKERRR